MKRAPLILCLAALGLVADANAFPQIYTLRNVVFSDGGTASGSFAFDPSAGTPCSTAASRCGRYSNVSITTTTGTSRTGATYTFVCGQDVPTCTGVSPDSTAALYLTTTAADQTGLPALAIFFTGVGAVPPQGLGTSDSPIDISNSSLAVGAAQEASCVDAACSAPGPPSRQTVSGQVVTVTYLLRYAANLSAGDSVVNLTNAGTVNGFEPAGDICANVYVFAQDQQLIACCTCPLTPNHLRTLSAQNDLISNTLTPGVPIGVTIALLASTGTCNASSVSPNNFAPGLRAWGTTLHAAPGGGFAVSETEFSPVALSPTELAKLTSYCGFIQANGSDFGICKSCGDGAAGAAKK